MGSGKLLQAAFRKHGIEHFTKEILHVFENEAEMNAKEAELVIVGPDSYNLCPGGQGGWGYVNENRPEGYYSRLASSTMRKHPEIIKQRQLAATAASLKKREENPWSTSGFTGYSHTDKTKQKMKISRKDFQLGDKNSQFGTFWITNGVDSKKTKGYIPEGWNRGRKCKR